MAFEPAVSNRAVGAEVGAVGSSSTHGTGPEGMMLPNFRLRQWRSDDETSGNFNLPTGIGMQCWVLGHL